MVIGQRHPFYTHRRVTESDVGSGTHYPLGITMDAAVYAATRIDSLSYVDYSSGTSGSGSGSGSGVSGVLECPRFVDDAHADTSFPYIHDATPTATSGFAARYALPFYPYFSVNSGATASSDNINIAIDFGRAVLMNKLVYPYIEIFMTTGLSSVGSGSGVGLVSIMDWGSVTISCTGSSAPGSSFLSGVISLLKTYDDVTTTAKETSSSGSLSLNAAGGVNLSVVTEAYFGASKLTITNQSSGHITLGGFSVGKNPVRLVTTGVHPNRYLPPFEITVRS